MSQQPPLRLTTDELMEHARQARLEQEARLAALEARLNRIVVQKWRPPTPPRIRTVVPRRLVTPSDFCLICLEEFELGSVDELLFCKTQCGTSFHAHCIAQLFEHNPHRQVCPNCREPMEISI